MINDFIAKFGIQGFAIPLVIFWLFLSIFLTIFNKKVYKKFSLLAWVPIFHLYLLGELTFNMMVGFLILFSTLLVTNFHVEYGNMQVNFGVIPLEYNGIKWAITALNLYIVVLMGITFLGIFKCINYKEKKKDTNDVRVEESLIDPAGTTDIDFNDNVELPISKNDTVLEDNELPQLNVDNNEEVKNNDLPEFDNGNEEINPELKRLFADALAQLEEQANEQKK